MTIMFPVGLTSTTLLLSAWRGKASGLHRVDGKEALNLPLATGAVVRHILQHPARSPLASSFIKAWLTFTCSS